MDKTMTKQKCLEFLREHEFGVIATVSKENEPEAATITYSVDDDLNIYFITRRQTRKFKNLQENPQVALVVGTGPAPETVQIQGKAHLLEGEEGDNSMVNFLVSKDSYYKVFLKLPGFDFGAFRIAPTWIRMLNADAKVKEEKYIQVL